MATNENTIELAYASLALFADDGTLDMGELNFLLGLALRDGTITDEERSILSNVFHRVDELDVTPAVWDRILAVKRQHHL